VVARITALAHAVPAGISQEELWQGYFAAQYGNDERAARVWRSAGVQRRHGVVDPTTVDIASWSTAARMQRYLLEAVPLSKEATSGALARAGLPATELGLFAVASCTGYVTPGLDIILARDLAMSAAVQRLGIGHMGCYAALPGLGTAADFVVARGRPAMLLCTELPSLHVQRAPGRLAAGGMDQLVAHALFADAAAAAVLAPAGPGWEVVDIEACTDTDTSDLMTWEVTDTGFRMGLSPRVPDVLARHVGPAVTRLLSRSGLAVDDIAGWAVHPGGPRILDVVADRLGLPDDALSCSAGVLRDYGNCSSATVLLVLERLLARQFTAGDTIVLLAFGPGLTLYVTLLRYTD
jgi:predicted naringenin-chalcone synthase